MSNSPETCSFSAATGRMQRTVEDTLRVKKKGTESEKVW